MDTFRYWLAVLLIVCVPPAVIFWLLVHPFIGFWRTRGPRLTYWVVTPVVVALGVMLFRWRDTLLGRDMGTNTALITLGILLYGVSVVIEWKCRRRLSVRTLVGVPEIKNERDGLLTDGIYGWVRHPRYLDLMLAILGWGLVANYVGTHRLWGFLVVGLLIVMHFEERELAARFGAEYAAYRARVPMLIPRLWTRRSAR